MVLLRDGRTLIGYLRSVDQFANLVLHRTIERIHVGKEYGDIPRGVFIVRGENVVLLGEIVRPLFYILHKIFIRAVLGLSLRFETQSGRIYHHSTLFMALYRCKFSAYIYI